MNDLSPPSELIRALSCTSNTAALARASIQKIIHGDDDRLMVIVGFGPVRDLPVVLKYAQNLLIHRKRFAGELEIVMKVDFEMPQANSAWRGMIKDPYMDGSFRMNDGLRLVRKLLCDMNELGVPAGTEMVDLISPWYLSDLLSWGTMASGVTESQVHRELASGLSFPVGFQSSPDGHCKLALDAIKAAAQPHHFMAVNRSGCSVVVSTHGNEDCHLIVRGGVASDCDFNAVPALHPHIVDLDLNARCILDVTRHVDADVDAGQISA